MTFNDHPLLELIESLPEALFLEDLDGNILDVNEQACELLGYEKEELLEMTVDDLVPEGAPAFLPDQIEEATRSGKPLETVNIRKGGTELPVELRGRIIDSEGKNRMLVSVRDTSQRVTAEKKFSKLFERGPEPAVLLDENGRIEDVNSRFEEVFNYKLERIKGRDINEVIVPERFQEEAKSLDKKGKQGYLNYETIRKGKSGEFPVSISATPVTIGNETYLLATYKDITQRVEAKEDLQAEQRLFDSIMNNTEDLVYFKDDQHRFQRVSQSYTELFNLEEEDMIGKTTEDFWPEAEEIMKDERKALNGEPVVGRERQVTLPDGEKRWYTIYKFPRRDADGNVIGLLGMDRDITERIEAEEELVRTQQKLKKSERRYRSYFQQLGDAVYITKVGGEDHGRILDANPTAEEQSGYSRQELIGMNIEEDLAVGPPVTMDYKTADKKLKEGEIITFTEQKRRKDGTEYWTEVLVTPIEYKGGVASLSINRDITERKQATQALDEERDKLKKLHDGVDKLQQQDTEEDVLSTAVEVAETMLDFEICVIDILEGDYLVPKANSASLDPEETTTFKIGEGIGGKTVQKGETIWGEDVRKHPDAKPTSEDFRAFISVPIGEIGVMQVVSKEVASFQVQDVELAEILAGHLREEIMRVRLEEKLRQQAICDPLTGLYNRRYFNQTLQKEIQQAKRYHKPLAFLMIDINRFKEINDRYSHQTGDKVLKEVASLLEENVRDADTVVRYGGDEFLIMMPETNGGVTNTVSRLKKELDRWNKRSDLLDFPLTLAIGASHWSPDQDRGVEEALHEADRKMYEDKESR